MFVCIAENKSGKLSIGTARSVEEFLTLCKQKDGKAHKILLSEKYTAKKNALIRVKQLKNKYKLR